MFNKWIRILHRWLAVPIIAVLIIAIAWSLTQRAAVPLPAWVGTFGVATLLALFITGVYLFLQHYWAKWRRGRRSS